MNFLFWKPWKISGTNLKFLPELEIYSRDSVDDELGVCDVVDQIICSHIQVGLSN